MAFRTRKRTYRKRNPATRKRYRAKRKYIKRSNKTTQSMSYLRGPFPRVFKTKLNWGDTATMTSTGGVMTYLQYRGNSAFDPKAAIGGNFPAYYESLCGAANTNAPYSAYYVTASSFKATVFIGADTENAPGMRSCISLTCCPGASLPPITVAEQMMRDDTRYRFIGRWDGGHDICRIKSYRKVAPVLGVKYIADHEGAKADFEHNPSDLMYWYLCASPVEGTLSTSYRCIIEMELWVTFYSLNDPLVTYE